MTYFRNGKCYTVRRTALHAGHGVLWSCAAMVIVESPVVNIDDEHDLQFARQFLERAGV